MGHGIPSVVDDPRSGQGDGAGANPGAAPQPDGCGGQPEDEVYSAVQDPAVRHRRADEGGDRLRHRPSHGTNRSRRTQADEGSLLRGSDRGVRGCQRKG
ncbi:MAG: hypothetical protein ACK55I_12200, partial [bacterium]